MPDYSDDVRIEHRRAATTGMSVRKLNVGTCDLDESLDRPGFRHAAAAIGERIGAERLGAGLYEAQAGYPIWPFHYHHAVEEWLYVISGRPVLRDAGGERALTAGDLACFPPGHTGAHTVSGPGRFIVISTDAPGPYIAVYPDSDKVAVAIDEQSGLVLPRGASVDYWHGEGGGPTHPVEVRREPAAPARPVVNAATVALDDRSDGVTLGATLGARRLEATVLELAPGQAAGDYSYAYGREEWALVLAGAPTLRHPGGEDPLEVSELVCFPEGPSGAHQLVNRGDQAVRLLVFSTTGLPVNVSYPDSGNWLMRNEPGVDAVVHPVR
jgi:uncharacterized cupin superfamily protein